MSLPSDSQLSWLSSSSFLQLLVGSSLSPLPIGLSILRLPWRVHSVDCFGSRSSRVRCILSHHINCFALLSFALYSARYYFANSVTGNPGKTWTTCSPPTEIRVPYLTYIPVLNFMGHILPLYVITLCSITPWIKNQFLFPASILLFIHWNSQHFVFSSF